MDKFLRTYVYITDETKSASELEKRIRQSPLANIRGDPTGLTLYYYDGKLHGESTTRPLLRLPPFREAAYTKLVSAVLAARCPPGGTPGLRSGEVAVVLDSGRPGHINKLMAPWKGSVGKKNEKVGDDDDGCIGQDESDADDKPDFKASVLNIIYTEESIKNRRKKVRNSTGSVRQMERAHMWAHARVCLPERARKHFEGTTSGDVIYGISKPDIASEWTLTWKQKNLSTPKNT